jgi:hypothetical protein
LYTSSEAQTAKVSPLLESAKLMLNFMLVVKQVGGNLWSVQ